MVSVVISKQCLEEGLLKELKQAGLYNNKEKQMNTTFVP
jgi:hypothetical protein